MLPGGSSVRLLKLGPKEARLETVNNPLFCFNYFRNAYRGIVCAGTELFCKKAYVKEVTPMCNERCLGVRLSWV